MTAPPAGCPPPFPTRPAATFPVIFACALLGQSSFTAAGLGWTALLYGPILLVTVLVHELGHSLAARSVGSEAHGILLWPLGGLAFVGHSSGPRGAGTAAGRAGMQCTSPAPARRSPEPAAPASTSPCRPPLPPCSRPLGGAGWTADPHPAAGALAGGAGTRTPRGLRLLQRAAALAHPQPPAALLGVGHCGRLLGGCTARRLGRACMRRTLLLADCRGAALHRPCTPAACLQSSCRAESPRLPPPTPPYPPPIPTHPHHLNQRAHSPKTDTRPLLPPTAECHAGRLQPAAAGLPAGRRPHPSGQPAAGWGWRDGGGQDHRRAGCGAGRGGAGLGRLD